MLTIIRRVLLLWLFMFWQGGFLFYGAVVVTIGSEVLASDFAQGLITRRVTFLMNLVGFAVLLAWIGDLVSEPATRPKRRWASWALLMLSLAALAWLHPQMDELIDDEARRLLDGAAFRHLHRWYLRVSALQGFISIAFTYWTLQNWRATDRLVPSTQSPE